MQLHSVYYEINETSTLYILVMNLAKYGSLLSKMLRLDRTFMEDEVRTIMIQLVLSIDLMHRKGIIHRDLKPDNVLMLEEETLNVCITDLGMACRDTDIVSLKLRCGTPGFVAPEILRNSPASAKTDIFSLGSMFFTMLTSSLLFKG